MTPIRKLSRRSFLTRIGGVAALGASVSGCVGFSDSDPYDPIVGGGYGPGGRGRGRGRSDDDDGRGRRGRRRRRDD